MLEYTIPHRTHTEVIEALGQVIFEYYVECFQNTLSNVFSKSEVLKHVKEPVPGR